MKLQNLTILKEKLISAKNFDGVWDYFFENFGMDQEFMRSGEQTKDEAILEFLEAVLKKTLDSETVETIQIKEISEYHFFHGGGMNPEKMEIITILYFKDIDIGIFVTYSLATNKVSTARFSRIYTKTDDPIFVPSASSAIQ